MDRDNVKCGRAHASGDGDSTGSEGETWLAFNGITGAFEERENEAGDCFGDGCFNYGPGDGGGAFEWLPYYWYGHVSDWEEA